MILGVILPLILLAVLGWLVPMALGRVMRRSLASLLLNTLVSALVLLVIAIVLFVWLYGPAAGRVWSEAPAYFLLLGVRSGLIWAPVMVLSVANLPRGWAAEDWLATGNTWGGLNLWTNYHERRRRRGDASDADFKKRGTGESTGGGDAP